MRPRQMKFLLCSPIFLFLLSLFFQIKNRSRPYDRPRESVNRKKKKLKKREEKEGEKTVVQIERLRRRTL